MIDYNFKRTSGNWQYRGSSRRAPGPRFYRRARILPADYTDVSKDFCPLYGVGRGGFPRGGGQGHCYGRGRGIQPRNRW